MNLDMAFDIYEQFLLQTRNHSHFETARSDEEGNERLLLRFDCGFNVELTNNKFVENSAVLRFWRNKDESVKVDCLEQLLREFGNSN